VCLVPVCLDHVSHQRLISEIAVLSDCPGQMPRINFINVALQYTKDATYFYHLLPCVPVCVCFASS
jgi:hypothetical protein